MSRILFRRMKHKYSTLKEKVRATLFEQQSSSPFYNATCPLCYFDHSVDVLSNARAAEFMSVERILRHIREAHADVIAMDCE